MTEKCVKACWWCKKFRYSNSQGGYSEYTPGSDFHISCASSIWKFDSTATTQEDFGKILQTAETCLNFELKADIIPFQEVKRVTLEQRLDVLEFIVKDMITNMGKENNPIDKH